MSRISSRPGSPAAPRAAEEKQTTTVRVHKPEKALVDFLMRTRGYPTTADAMRAITHEWLAFRAAAGDSRNEFPIPVIVDLHKFADELAKLNEPDLAHYMRQFEAVVRGALRKPHATREAVDALMTGLVGALRVFADAEDLNDAPKVKLVPSAQGIITQANLNRSKEE